MAGRILIRGGAPPLGPALFEAWSRRDLLWFFIAREFKVRYRQTLLGAGWVVAQPLLAAAVFALVFGRVVGVPSDGIPYPLFVFAGTSIWFYFSGCLTRSTVSVVGNAGLLKKVYFPRVFVPLSPVVAGLADLAITLAVLGAYAMFTIGCSPLFLLRAVIPIAVAFLAALGTGFWLSAIAARYRDIVLAAPFVSQIWLFLTPVVYPLSLVPEGFRWLMWLNPMSGATEGIRWALRGGPAPDHLGLTACIAGCLCVTGFVAYVRLERRFADVL